MKTLGGIILGFLIAGLVAVLLVATGAYNVAATSPPGKFEQKVATFALNRSVAKRAPARNNPILRSADVLREGLAHYKENCVVCHGAPGVDASEAGQGLNPPAPDLTLPRVQERPDGQVFWIIANGIRMTGMPAFSPTHKEEEIWKIVAFVRHLPEVTPEEQKTLKPASEEAEHHHERLERAPEEEHPTKPAPATKTQTERESASHRPG